MQKLKKVRTLVVLCVKKPKTIWKGIQYLFRYGYVGMRQNMKSRVEHELSPEEVPVKIAAGIYEGDVRFSVIMPVYNVEVKWLERAIDSVKAQSYRNWELCIVDDCSTKVEVRRYLEEIQDDRIKILLSENNKGISGASNEAVSLASGQFLALLDNDDELSPDALFEMYQAIKEQDVDVVYSDMDIIDTNNVHSAPIYKPDWSPELFTSQMYVGHLLCVKRELFDMVGGFQTEFNGSQDYDLLFRIAEKTDRIGHVSKVLYSWRALSTSTAVNAASKPYAQTAGVRAVQAHLDRVLGEGKAKALETENLFVYDVRYQLEKYPLVSVLIPTKDHAEDLKAAIDSIYDKTTYPNYEILVLDNNSEEAETFAYFKELGKKENVRLVKASYPFNWSKINNQGMELAAGEVIVCLNNDVIVIEPEWMTRLVEKAVQDRIGTVGGMLLYPDGTIQHAGIVVGIGGWADHVYKGCEPVHHATPFISPMVTRNVTASTGACLAFRKELAQKFGGFNETFIICGSDVEFSLRLIQNGYRNVYDPKVRLYHYESKSRDSYIPDIDFSMSALAYKKYRELGDPYYNKNLDYSNCVPTVTEKEQFHVVKLSEGTVGEIHPMRFRKVTYPEKRINLVVPSINTEHVFGGIATALKFFAELTEALGWNSRIILADAQPSEEAVKKYSGEFAFVSSEEESFERRQIISFAFRDGLSLPVSENDYFVFTGWWTAYCVQEAYRKLMETEFLSPQPFVYFIQDYEPGFYPWSTHYMLADSTYRSSFRRIAIFNSHELKEYFVKNGYRFEAEMEFAPVLNQGLKDYLSKMQPQVHKKKQILVYGRPGTKRNAFELVVEALRRWAEQYEDAAAWEIVSAGEWHEPVALGKGKVMYSLGKMSIDQYALVLEESYAGISLMVSPHPSYPPLEMAVFDVNVITNTYGNKDLAAFNPHITSLSDASPLNIAKHLEKICRGYQPVVEHLTVNEEYCNGQNLFPFIGELCEKLNQG